MEELIKTVAAKAGINDDQAKAAIEAVLEQVTDKLPGPIGEQVASALGGEGGGGLMDSAKGLLGRS
jgi:uncharacterized protein (DUF2267 family)